MFPPVSCFLSYFEVPVSHFLSLWLSALSLIFFHLCLVSCLILKSPSLTSCPCDCLPCPWLFPPVSNHLPLPSVYLNPVRLILQRYWSTKACYATTWSDGGQTHLLTRVDILFLVSLVRCSNFKRPPLGVIKRADDVSLALCLLCVLIRGLAKASLWSS